MTMLVDTSIIYFKANFSIIIRACSVEKKSGQSDTPT